MDTALVIGSFFDVPCGSMLGSPYFRGALVGKRLDYLTERERAYFPPPVPRYKLGLIGAGIMGTEHIRVSTLEGRAVVHGIYDRSPQSCEAASALFNTLRPNNTLHKYSTLREACLDPNTDALIISTPNYTHLEVLKHAMESGKPILLEKPMAATLSDAKEIVACARGYSSFIQVGLQYRYKAMYIEARHEALERRSIGDIKTIAITEHRIPFLDKRDQWNKFSKYSGGTLVEKCCHYFDLFNIFADSRPHLVSALGDRAVNFKDFSYKGERADIIDNAFVNIVYQNGIKANFNLCMFAPLFHEEIVICGNQGRIQAFEQEDFLAGKKIRCGFEMHCANRIPSRTAVPQHPALIQESGHNGSTFFEHVSFIDTIEGRESSAATVEEGLWSVIVGVAAEEAARAGSAVYIADLLKRHNIEI